MGRSAQHKTSGHVDLKLTRQLSLKRIVLVYTGLIIITAIVALAVAQSQNAATSLPDPFRPEQRSAVSFTLYYPSQLPDNMQVDPASLVRADGGVVTMRITDGRGSLGHGFTITQQAASQEFNYETFFSSFQDKAGFDTDLGYVTTGSIDNGKTRLASLVIGKTWILLQAPPTLQMYELTEIMQHLKPSLAPQSLKEPQK